MPEDSNFVLITLDSCRYDSYTKASTPNLDKYGEPHLVYSQAWYTLPSHMAMFTGTLPFNLKDKGYYNKFEDRFFRLKGGDLIDHPSGNINDPTSSLYGSRKFKVVYKMDAEKHHTIISAFNHLGYETIGIGGVRWFSPQYATTKVLRQDFQTFWYEASKATPYIYNSWENQIEALKSILNKNDSRKKFIFINVPATHHPYQRATEILGYSPKDQMAQIKQVEYIDEFFPEFIKLIPKPAFVVIVGDHGDCFGEGGLWGHGSFHPILLEVPMLVFEVNE